MRNVFNILATECACSQMERLAYVLYLECASLTCQSIIAKKEMPFRDLCVRLRYSKKDVVDGVIARR